MSEDFLKDPLSLFSVKGKTAIVTGASGAFGAMAAKVLAGAGANVVICANGAEALKKVARRMRDARRQGRDRRQAARVRKPIATRSSTPRSKKFGRVDILVVASGQNKVSKIVDQKPEDFLDVMDANVTQSWLMARAAGAADAQAGQGRQDHPDVVGARPARPSGRLHRLLRVEVGGRRHHQGARLRAGGNRHHRQCARARPSSARR